MSADTPDPIDEQGLPLRCPTCTSTDPNTYYGSCFDNQHSTVFDPRLPLDPWHAYMRELAYLRRTVDALEVSVRVGRELLAEAKEQDAAGGLRVVAAPGPDDVIAALLEVAHAAWHLADDSGELDTQDMPDFHGDYVHLKLDHERLSDALDALEATGWDAHPEPLAAEPDSDPVPVDPTARDQRILDGLGWIHGLRGMARPTPGGSDER